RFRLHGERHHENPGALSLTRHLPVYRYCCKCDHSRGREQPNGSLKTAHSHAQAACAGSDAWAAPPIVRMTTHGPSCIGQEDSNGDSAATTKLLRVSTASAA